MWNHYYIHIYSSILYIDFVYLIDMRIIENIRILKILKIIQVI